MLNLVDWPTFRRLVKAVCKGGLKNLHPECGIAFYFGPKLFVML